MSIDAHVYNLISVLVRLRSIHAYASAEEGNIVMFLTTTELASKDGLDRKLREEIGRGNP